KRAGVPPEANGSIPAAPVADSQLTAVPAEIDGLIRQQVRDTVPLRAVQSHIVNLYLSTNRLGGLDNPRGSAKDIQSASQRFQFGISPRGAGDVMLAAK